MCSNTPGRRCEDCRYAGELDLPKWKDSPLPVQNYVGCGLPGAKWAPFKLAVLRGFNMCRDWTLRENTAKESVAK